MTYMRDRGVLIPDDLSVIGFDDLYGDQCIPGLTTVSHMLFEMGEAAVEKAMRVVEGKKVKAGVTYISSKLVIRGSTAPPRGRGVDTLRDIDLDEFQAGASTVQG
jgi:DNA-binding LacI/PurR family transcriptional regulator